MSAVLSAVRNGFSRVVSAVRTGVSSALSAITSKVGSFRRAGSALAGAVADGIKSKIGAAKRAAKRLASAIRGAMPGSDADWGPLSDITDSGASIPLTIAREVVTNLRPVKRASGELAEAARPEFAGNVPGGYGRRGGGGVLNDIDVTVTINGPADRAEVEDGVNDGLVKALKATNVRR